MLCSNLHFIVSKSDFLSSQKSDQHYLTIRCDYNFFYKPKALNLNTRGKERHSVSTEYSIKRMDQSQRFICMQWWINFMLNP